VAKAHGGSVGATACRDGELDVAVELPAEVPAADPDVDVGPDRRALQAADPDRRPVGSRLA